MVFDSLFRIVMSVMTVAAVLCLIAVAVSWVTRKRRPAIEHACWVIVLLRLVTPPILPLTIPGYPEWSLSTSTSNRDGAAERSQVITDGKADIAVSNADGLEMAQRFPRHAPDGGSDGDRVDETNDAGGNLARARPNAITHPAVSAGDPEPNQPSVAVIGPATEDTQAAPESGTADEKQLPTHAATANASASALQASSGASRIRFQYVLWALLMTWVAGSVFVLTKSVRSVIAFRKLLKLSQPASADIIAIAARIASRLGLRELPQVRTLAVQIPPLVWSRAWRPYVVIPSELAISAESTSIELLLAHELAHVKRGDYLVRSLEWLATVIWWWCPVFLYARRKMRMAEEAACDAWVLRLWPERAAEYARAIVETVCFVGSKPMLPQLTTGGLGSVREVESRLRAIHENRTSARNGAISIAAAAILTALSCPIFLIGEPAENETGRTSRVTSSEEPSTTKQQTKPPTASNDKQQINALDEPSKSAGTFNADAVLAANRLWQNPKLNGIESIEFTHRMAPRRLDERFLWRSDGAHSVEVVHREDKAKQYGVGWSVVRMPDASSFTFGNPEAFPRYRTPEETLSEDDSRRVKPLTPTEAQRRKMLRHLSGTRLNFTAMDWGRRPTDFVVTNHAQDNESHTVELRATKDAIRNFELNAGAMFETTSWAYVHDLRINRSILTIDQQNRILRERSYLDDKLLAEIELLDWTTTADGQHAPLRITMSFPESEFKVDQRFRVTDEGLWILNSGSSQFATLEAQTEEIIDLRINSPPETLGQRIEKATKRLREVSLAAKDSSKIRLRGLTPLELGATHDVDATPSSRTSALRPTSLVFTPVNTAQRFREMWPHPELVAEMRFPNNPVDNGSAKGSVLLALYDEYRLPLFALNIPAAAINSNAPATDTVLSSLWEKHRLWLRPADETLPKATYSFHLQDRVIEATLPSKKEELNRGIKFSCALDAFRKAPEQWRVPVAFSADWNGRMVHVLGVTGPSFGQVFGSGLDGGYVGGYSVTNSTNVLLVVDATTGFPLLERSNHMQFEFLDYVEATPGQFAPLRILCRTGSMQMDLRFQIVDGKLWLFDRRAGTDIKVPAFVDNIRMDGAIVPLAATRRSQTPDATGALPEFNWGELMNRRAIRGNDSLSASLAAWEKPWTHPLWEAISRLSIDANNDGSRIVRCSFRSWPSLGIARYWTLTLLTDDLAQPLSCAETLPPGDATTVATMPFNLDETVQVPRLPEADHKNAEKWTNGGSATDKTRVFQLKSRRDEKGDTLLELEILSTNWYTDQSVRVTALLVNSDGVAIHGGIGGDSFRTHAEPVLRKELRVIVPGVDKTAGNSILIGCRSVITGAPMGSTWGMLMNEDPLFEPALLLGSRFPAVRHVGLQQIYREQWRELTRQFESRGDRDQRAMQVLAPHLVILKSVLSSKNGDAEEAIAIACRLAGFSQDPDFTEPLRALLSHKSEEVRDSAAIGLGLLGNADGLSRLKELAARPVQEHSPTDHPLANRSIDEARWALQRLEK